MLLIDSTDEEALTNAPLENVDVAIVGIGEDMEASILTTALLKKMGIPFIIARAVSDIHFRVLRQVGADEVFNLEIEEGRVIAQRLISHDILDTIPISTDFSIAEIYPPAHFMGKAFAALEEKVAVRVMAIKRLNTSVDNMGNPLKEETVRLAEKTDVVRENDILLVVGKNALPVFGEVTANLTPEGAQTEYGENTHFSHKALPYPKMISARG